MTALAGEHGAINLAQGYPDFSGPPEIIEAAVEALREGHNQYARSMGDPELVAAIARERDRIHGLAYDPHTEVVVFCGATEGIASSMLGVLDPGDEVILFEPYFDSYPASVAMAGGRARYYTLRYPDYSVDGDRLDRLFNERTRLLVLNSPHNPTGKVFTQSELQLVAELALEHDCYVLADEVYEHLTYDGTRHLPIAALPSMRDRTLSLSSVGKTYSVTGWKIGWATGPADMVAAAQAAHQFVTFCSAAPLQRAASKAIDSLGPSYMRALRDEYTVRRTLLADALHEAGFSFHLPAGTYYILADFASVARDGEDDLAFAKRLTVEHGIAAIPPSVFYTAEPEQGRGLIRFSFCKSRETLAEAAQRLRKVGRTRF